ncbi:protein PLANT CADMIUM RESISTANCE [Trifolium repens]|nr:protein PLANT CADMIUM RESISTANCE [Trifolium repens]
MRKQYGLKGNCCTDCMKHCCCEYCALCQEYRELENRGFNMVIGWHGNVLQRTGGMAMSTTTTAPAVGSGMNRLELAVDGANILSNVFGD